VLLVPAPRRTLIVSFCLLMMLPAAPALAKKKHKKKSAGLGPVVTVTAVGNPASTAQDSTATASCPTGKEALGGGFSAPFAPGGTLVVHSSYRSSPQSWTTAAWAAGGTGSVTSYAYCRNVPRNPVSDVAQSVDFPSSGVARTLTPTCPSGTQLIGGGFQSTTGPAAGDFAILQVNAPGAASESWAVTGLQNTSAAQSLTAHAYCLGGIRQATLVNGANAMSVSPADAISATSATCPVTKQKKRKGRKKRKKRPAQLLTAGGFSGPVASGGGGAVAIYTDSRIGPSGGWSATARDGSGSGTLSLTSYGLCV
jgi:hypothetical protein